LPRKGRRGRGAKPVSKPRVLFLETELSQPPISGRRQTSFMEEFFRNLPRLELVPRQVHSAADLRKFLDYARRDRAVKAVHIVAHGEQSAARRVILLTGGEQVRLDRPEGLSLFRDLKTEVIFFSCCLLGRDVELMRSVLRASGAKAIFSYTDHVNDYQAFIVESLFYHLAYGYVGGEHSRMDLREVYERLKFSLYFLGIDHVRDPLTRPLLVADFAEDLSPEEAKKEK
jgi:hypothetical protein